MQHPDPNSNRSKRKAVLEARKASFVATRPPAGMTDNVPLGTYYGPRFAICCKCHQDKMVWETSGGHEYRDGILYEANPVCEECSK